MRLKPGAPADSLIDNLRQFEQQLESASKEPNEVRQYARLLDTIELTLRHHLEDGDLADALFTDRYWHILTGTVASAFGALDQECRYQAWRLGRVRAELEALRGYAQGEGTLVVPDTNVLVHCGTIRDIDWCTHAQADEARLIIPLIVVDELDELKRIARDKSDRTTIRDNLRALKQMLADRAPGTAVPLAEGVTVAILPDPRGHRRLPSNDEEICDRADLLAHFTGPVVLATNDNGMHVRAQGYGLSTIEIPEPSNGDS